MVFGWAKQDDEEAKVNNDINSNNSIDSDDMEIMQLKLMASGKVERTKKLILRSRVPVCLLRILATVIVWSCVLQLMTLFNLWALPSILQNMRFSYTTTHLSPPLNVVDEHRFVSVMSGEFPSENVRLEKEKPVLSSKPVVPPKSKL